MTSQAPMPNFSSSARRPLSSSNQNALLQPPTMRNAALSPHKQQSSSPYLQNSTRPTKLKTPSMGPPSETQKHTTDSLKKGLYVSKFKTGPAKPNSIDYNDFKENVHPQMFAAPPTVNFSVDGYYKKPNGKRGLMDPAPISSRDERPMKKTKTETQTAPTAHDSFPVIHDDGGKPGFSYAQLIGMAILQSPNRRLSLSQIYKWISDNFAFYRSNESGWQNSIRHNLSLHKSFIKMERPKEDPGKGSYWAVEPGAELSLLKEKLSRKPTSGAENLPVMSTSLEPSGLNPPATQEPTLPPQPAPSTQTSLPALPPSTVGVVEPSSDATILVSDGAAPEDGTYEQPSNDAMGSSLQSPLLGPLHSSPPVPRRIMHDTGTPPSMRHQRGSSVSRPRKNDSATMHDSGYLSSLESSVLRAAERIVQPALEAGKRRTKKQRYDMSSGRAEEEIARLRNSSPFSPSRRTKSASAFSIVSSSPLRQARGSQMLPPLTPVVQAKPRLQPTSPSPGTNLALHRDMVKNLLQTPETSGVGLLNDMTHIPFSPAFGLDYPGILDDNFFDGLIPSTTNYDVDSLNVGDHHLNFSSPIRNMSPIKKSTQRNGVDRITSTPRFLGSAKNKHLTSVPVLKLPNQSPRQLFETPSKALEGIDSPSKFLQSSPIRNRSPMVFHESEAAWGGLPLESGTTCLTIPHGQDGNVEFDIFQSFPKIGSKDNSS